MILIPYFIDTLNPNWSKFSVFLCDGGRSLWDIDDKMSLAKIKKMLKEYGFPLLDLKKIDGVMYARVDHSKLDIKEFYTWMEVDPDTSDKEIWRTLLIPTALWSCPVFKEQFFMTAGLPRVAMAPLVSLV